MHQNGGATCGSQEKEKAYWNWLADAKQAALFGVSLSGFLQMRFVFVTLRGSEVQSGFCCFMLFPYISRFQMLSGVLVCVY